MRKHLLILALLGALPLCAQEAPQPQETQESVTVQLVQTVSKSSIAAHRMDSKLNEVTLHKTVLDYSLPPEIEDAARTCTQGQEDCYFTFKTFENAADTRVAAAANLELAVLAMQRGLVKQALGHIEKAGKLAPDDPFIELTHGWMLLSAGKYKKAHETFDHLLYLSADFEYVSSAKLGTALALYFSGHKDKATEQLQYLYVSNPYAISFVSYMLGRIAAETKAAKKMAPVFLQQALSHDEKNYAAAELFAKLSEKDKDKLRAWQYYATLYSLDPHNKELADKIEKYAQDFGNKKIDYLFYLRLEQPIVHEMKSTPSALVKMALYADRNQLPQELQKVTVMASGTVKITDEKRGEILRVPSYIEKNIEFNSQTKGVDFKNSKGQTEFSAAYPFKLAAENQNKTLLVKNALTENIFSANLSDKELKGGLWVIPGDNGFLLVNEVYAEDLIPALLAAQVQDVTHEAALKALAVVLRSALLQVVEENKDKPYHITDNDVKFQFKGINLIFNTLLEASKTSGEIQLTETASAYANCGVVTADTVANTENKPAYVFSPANVSRYLLSNPPADLFSRPQDPTQWSGIKWIYLFDAKAIEKRISYKKGIGKLRAMTPTKLSPNGRILAMRFEGSKTSYEATTPQEIAFVISAGTMRSNFFDLVPLYKGKNIHTVLVRGYDSGLGEGLCLRGAEGLAKQGADYKGIIKYYFPEGRILNTTTGEIH
ncbi:MAG: hypothetical protein J6Q05_04510 [Elusimicrobiaceae bacterium]|nr:hypothetical protein [Elusimicrobiaceae bacterium]